VDAHLRWLLNWNGCRFQRDSLPPHRPASPAKGRGVTIRRSLGITAATRVVVVALSFATVVIVSRLLTPEEIGIFSVTVALVGLGHVFRDFGVAHYLIQTPEVTVQRKRAAFTVTLALSWTVALLLVLLKPAAVHFYDDQRVGQVLLLLVVNFLILPFGAQLRTLLQRDMQFKKLAVVNLSNHFVQSLTTVAAAWAGASYMSMAWGSIAGNLANVAVLILISPKGALDWPTRHGIGEVLSFGAKASTASFATAAGGAAPDLILGRTLGFADVAFYSRAKGLIGMALDQLMYVVSSVYTPAFAKGVREGRNAAELYGQATGLLLGLTVPVIALLAVTAPALIVALFGEPWARSGPLGTLFCLFGLITAPFVLASSSLVAAGHVRSMMRTRLAIEGTRLAVLATSIALVLEEVVALLGVAYLTEALVYMLALRRHTGLTVSSLGRGIWRSYLLGLLTALAPAIIVGLHGRLFSAPLWLVLAGACAAGAVSWLIGLEMLGHPLKPEVWALIRRVARRGRAVDGRRRK
jgi:O-antigen/teichoic acid export membrane protein